ncbi:unnamed protein product [Rotaria sp. Silwood2]|nr:unnamed protein product [Rotaria sp. Silwood2]CAF2589807.1 unnamed protein product [Rotaria sp. Silwood2]CAF2997009.1 unnamed protein product [Rotaria sp. Silwood2]CAF4199337.1 unnamed protein product [Rotaria sp. Silwood2]CAF4259854.1 unnamed protein product [Rotaria sp. Silwood2]
MLLYLFIIFQTIRSISCVITCSVCPIDANSFYYFVTTDRLPYSLNNCTLQTIGDNCFIDVIWHRKPDKTEITLSTRENPRTINNEHNLFTDASLENKNSNFVWTRSISYTCSTNYCNSLTVLKRLLNSLTSNDSFNELEYLLKIEEPFDGNWCWFEKNITSLECAASIPPESCKGCFFQGKSRVSSIEICASCLQDDIGETALSHEVDFNMTDRTRTDHWILECKSRNCNTKTNGNLIRQKSTSDFDFIKFLDDANNSNILSHMSKIMLLVIVFLIKLFN